MIELEFAALRPHTGQASSFGANKARKSMGIFHYHLSSDVDGYDLVPNRLGERAQTEGNSSMQVAFTLRYRIHSSNLPNGVSLSVRPRRRAIKYEASRIRSGSPGSSGHLN
jgi:hypothetical protein